MQQKLAKFGIFQRYMHIRLSSAHTECTVYECSSCSPRHCFVHNCWPCCVLLQLRGASRRRASRPASIRLLLHPLRYRCVSPYLAGCKRELVSDTCLCQRYFVMLWMRNNIDACDCWTVIVAVAVDDVQDAHTVCFLKRGESFGVSSNCILSSADTSSRIDLHT